MTVIRVGFMRCKPEQYAEFRDRMQDSAAVLEPGIKRLPGLIHFYAGENEADCSLTNVSIWTTLEAARQMDTFEPMVRLAREFAADGATPVRPIITYTQQWEIVP
jgi:hypothetical protein